MRNITTFIRKMALTKDELIRKRDEKSDNKEKGRENIRTLTKEEKKHKDKSDE